MHGLELLGTVLDSVPLRPPLVQEQALHDSGEGGDIARKGGDGRGVPAEIGHRHAPIRQPDTV
ncbi:hypothetical protein GCM10010167_66460 [Paractinoplanes deccanensis]